MRIFIALLFDAKTKQKIDGIADQVEELCETGHFTERDNLHLTLLFLGETEPDMLEKIQKKLAEIKFRPFVYTTRGLDVFKKGKTKRIVYLGIEKSFTLDRLYQLVCLKLRELGLDFPTEKYTPHVTLTRQATLTSDEDLAAIKPKPISIEANRISIMESTRIDGRLTYIEVGSVPFIEQPSNRQS